MCYYLETGLPQKIRNRRKTYMQQEYPKPLSEEELHLAIQEYNKILTPRNKDGHIVPVTFMDSEPEELYYRCSVCSLFPERRRTLCSTAVTLKFVSRYSFSPERQISRPEVSGNTSHFAIIPT